MQKGLKIVKDKYYRGNGRWVKITRLHDKDSNGNWIAKYCIAFGIEGEIRASAVDYFRTRKTAEIFAKDYIKTGEKTV